MMKKLSAILLALVMVLSMTATAFATTVNVDESAILAGHTFTAYQVFKGDWSAEDNTVGVLSNVAEGDGVNFPAFLADLKAQTAAPFMKEVTPEGEGEATEVNIFADCATAEAVAKVLSDNNNEALAKAVAEIAYANIIKDEGTALVDDTNDLAHGYYLIVDSGNVAAGSAYNKALLQVVGNDITIALKTDAPSVEKKVYENTKYNTNADYGQGFNDVADYNMGDAVPFHLIGKIPNMTEYDKYMYVFHDTYSAGLDAPQNVKVYLSADKQLDTTADVEVTSSFTFAGDTSARTFSLTCIDLKAVVAEKDADAQYVIVAYTAVLNQNAEVGLPGNPNEVYLEYANNPNWDSEGWKDGVDNDNDGETDEENEKPEDYDKDQPTGNTPVDKVIVFTYKLDTTKIDGATADAETPTKLAGAEFVLYRAIDNKYAVVHQCNDECGDECDKADKIIGWVESQDDASPLKSDASGLFKVIGLDDGTYYLEETKAPTGYNLLKNPITVVISATTSNGQNWVPDFVPSLALTDLAVTADGEPGTGDVETGTASITVENNKGATLPETGGMGTTILYIVGGLLVLGAAVLLITKKRMENN